MDEFIVVDTDILVDVARGINETAEFLSSLKSGYQLYISIITEMELIVGCRNKSEIAKLDQFLVEYEKIGLSEDIGTKSKDLISMYRLSHGLLIPDAIIAASALINECRLFTKNRKDFQYIPNLNLIPFPT